MDFETTFPVRYWINLGRRADRRAKMEARFDQAGLTVERFPAVDAKFVRRMALERNKEKMPGDSGDGVRGYENAGRYALALSQRLAIRRAKHAGATSPRSCRAISRSSEARMPAPRSQRSPVCTRIVLPPDQRRCSSISPNRPA